MSRICSICSSPNKGRINKLLIDGKSAAFVAAKFSLSYQVVQRHKKNHILHGITTQAYKERMNSTICDNLPTNFGESYGVDIPSNFKYYHDQLLVCYQTSMAKDDIQTAIKALREARECSTTVLKTLQYLKPKGRADDLKNIITSIMRVLDKYPEVKVAVSKSLDGVSF